MANVAPIGLSCALMTPFTAAGAIDIPLLVRHARRTLKAGCDSITVFGTTGEGPMIATAERPAVFGALQVAGFDMGNQIIGGVLTNAPEDAIEQCRMIYRQGCRAVLLAPPFYFPDPSEDGLFAWYEAVIRGLGSEARDIILYHIPQFTGAALTIALVNRLAAAFPGVIIGVKDSKGVWAETEARVKAHPGLQILVGNEADLAAAVRLGGKGTICGFANFIAGSLGPVARQGKDHEDIARLGRVIAGIHFLAAFKAVMAHVHNEPAWLNIRPPLAPLSAADAQTAVARWDREFPGKTA